MPQYRQHTTIQQQQQWASRNVQVQVYIKTIKNWIQANIRNSYHVKRERKQTRETYIRNNCDTILSGKLRRGKGKRNGKI